MAVERVVAVLALRETRAVVAVVQVGSARRQDYLLLSMRTPSRLEPVERMQVQGRLKGQMVQIPSFLLSPLLVAVVVAQASVSTVPMAGVVAVGHNLRRRL